MILLVGKANQSITTKFFIFIRFRRDEGKVFGRDNLIGIDVLLQLKREKEKKEVSIFLNNIGLAGAVGKDLKLFEN